MELLKEQIVLNGDGSADYSVIDYDEEKGPYWYVFVDGTPVSPDRPLPLTYALREFERCARQAIEEDDGESVELRPCTSDDLEWAGVTGAADRGE
ncbi:hypothetical protein ACIBG8_07430 [Nonomuraea sp. NPDC050556]|uniref:hypothetical protein n=1 Tax=Nonomuraea sp. NPDC050556 TaxID=3364369 RepID=UPI00378BB5AE